MDKSCDLYVEIEFRLPSQLLTFDVPIRGTFSEREQQERESVRKKKIAFDDASANESYERAFSLLSSRVLKRDNPTPA